MSTKPTRRFVRMFQPQFAPLVQAGTKCQTVRPIPDRIPKVGDTIDCREWTGKPYRSAQRRLAIGEITVVEDCRISDAGVMIGTFSESYETMEQPGGNRERFARADGFQSFEEMRNWFRREHGLPFKGILIKWKVIAASPMARTIPTERGIPDPIPGMPCTDHLFADSSDVNETIRDRDHQRLVIAGLTRFRQTAATSAPSRERQLTPKRDSNCWDYSYLGPSQCLARRSDHA